MKKFYLIIFLFIFSIQVFSQSYSLSGQVIDTLSKDPLAGANIIVYSLPDSTAYGAATDKEGKFKIPNLTNGRYLLVISYVGYRTFKRNFGIRNRSMDFEKIYLSPIEIETDEVQVIDQKPPVVQNADTTEFNADAFKVTKNADAHDLVTKMPGVVVQDGKIQAQGEDVKRVLLDGKRFFGDDPNAVLRNVPAEIIEKIQVFDQQSEQSRFSGFDDGNTSKTLNIVTRNRVRQGTFGRVLGGYGDEERYVGGGNINFFNGDQRISLLGQLNNINEQNFSSEDLLGVMSSGSRGGSRFGGGMPGGGRIMIGGSRGGGGFGGGGGFSGGGASDFRVNAQNGVNETKAFGLNYSDKWGEKFEISGSYFFNMTDNDAQSVLRREFFLSENSGQLYNENSSAMSENLNHRFNMRVEYSIDTLNSIMFLPTISFQKNDGSQNLFGINSSGASTLSSTSNLFNSNLSALNSSAELLYRKRFEKIGRTLSISLNGSYVKNTGDNDLFSESVYNDTATVTEIINQVSGLTRDGYAGSSNIVYTEPLTENSQLQFNTRFSLSEDESDQKTFSFIPADNAYSLLDTALSSTYKKSYNTQSYGSGYRYRKEGIMLNFNLNYNISSLKSNEVYPKELVTERNFFSILPSLMFQYNISRDNNLRLFYRTNNQEPRIEQLQDVLDNSNALQLKVGNPGLKQNYSHFLNVHYSQMDIKTLHSFFIRAGVSLIQDYIGNNTIIAQRDTVAYENIILRQGTQITRPENIDGYISLRSLLIYSLPFELIKSNVNFDLSANYTRSPGIINGITNYSNSTTYGLGIVISSNISEDFDFSISGRSSFSTVKNSKQTSSDNTYLIQNTGIKLNWRFWSGFGIKSELNHQYNSGLSEGYDRNSILLNAGIFKNIFSDDRGEIRFSIYDLLNKNLSIQRNVTDFYVEDTSTNQIGRYFLLQFIYNIRTFGS